MNLSIHQLGKRYNRDWIFKDFSFEFNPGNTYAITGPNGSGKSTLMQVLWGQLPPSKGNIKYSINEAVIDLDALHQHLAIAAPYQDLPESLTLKELIDFHFSFKKPRKNYSKKDIIDLAELSHASSKFVHQFSSGMKQRLKLALALLSDVELVFLDEPGTNLDDEARAWYKKMLKIAEIGRICFIASNDLADFPSEYQEINLDILKNKRVT